MDDRSSPANRQIASNRQPLDHPCPAAAPDSAATVPAKLPAENLRARSHAMITVGMNYRVLPGKQHDFEDKFKSVLSALNGAAGHTSSTLWRDISDDSSYLITSEWSDEQAFTAFIQSPEFRAVTNWGKEQILAGRPQHKIYKH
jgi:heme-degrading monooxygenase HmoA